MADKKQTSKTAAPKASAKKAPAAKKASVTMTRLRADYVERIHPALMTEFGYSNPMQAPRLQKVVLNMGLGKAHEDKKMLESALADMAKISGQAPVVTRAKKSIATFKIREGMPIGCKVTLRGARMYFWTASSILRSRGCVTLKAFPPKLLMALATTRWASKSN